MCLLSFVSQAYEAEAGSSDLVFRFRLMPGSVLQSHAFNVATTAGLPEKLLKRAAEESERMKRNSEKSSQRWTPPPQWAAVALDWKAACERGDESEAAKLKQQLAEIKRSWLAQQARQLTSLMTAHTNAWHHHLNACLNLVQLLRSHFKHQLASTMSWLHTLTTCTHKLKRVLNLPPYISALCRIGSPCLHISARSKFRNSV